MSIVMNKALIVRYFYEVWNEGNLGVVEHIFAPHFVGHTTAGRDATSPDEVKALVSFYHNAFPDLQFMIDEQVADGDSVITRWTAHGSHQGDFLDMPATGQPITIMGLTSCRFSGDKVIEMWDMWDTLYLLQQLGVVPRIEALADVVA